MKIAFLIPVLEDIDISRTYDIIKEACDGTEFEIIFAINGKLNRLFTNLRNTFIDKAEVRAFMIDRPEDEHKLITMGMTYCNDYDATIIYSAKEEPNLDVIRAFITSWKAGNKIVYLKKEYSGLKNIDSNNQRKLRIYTENRIKYFNVTLFKLFFIFHIFISNTSYCDNMITIFSKIVS